MKIKRLLKLNQDGFSHVELGLAVAVIVMVGLVGVHISKRNNTHALTPSTTQSGVVYDNAATAQANNSNLTVVTDTVANLGDQSVVQLNPGQSAAFGPFKGGGGWHPTSDCYSLRAPSSSVNAVIASGSSSMGITVPENFYYSSHCVDYSKVTTSNPSSGYSVKNRSDSTGPLYLSGRYKRNL